MSITVEQVAEHALMRLIARVAMLVTPVILGTFLSVYLSSVGTQTAKIDALTLAVTRLEYELKSVRAEQGIRTALICDLYKKAYRVETCPAQSLTKSNGYGTVP